MQVSELVTQLNDMGTQIEKAKTEITSKVAALEEAVANAGTLPQEVQDAVAGLKTSVQTLDDLNPDPVVEQVQSEGV